MQTFGESLDLKNVNICLLLLYHYYVKNKENFFNMFNFEVKNWLTLVTKHENESKQWEFTFLILSRNKLSFGYALDTW